MLAILQQQNNAGEIAANKDKIDKNTTAIARKISFRW